MVYLPNRNEFFLWGEASAAARSAALTGLGAPALANVVTPGKRGHVEGRALPLFDTLARLAVVPAAEVPALPASVASWTLASKLALDLTSRERIVPTVVRANGKVRARWAAALHTSEDAGRVNDIARSMPPAAYAVPAAAGRSRLVWAPEALLRTFLDAAIDTLVRAANGGPAAPERAGPAIAPKSTRTTRRKQKTNGGGAPADDDHRPWEDRWLAALEGRDDSFEPQGFAERTLVDDLDSWSRPVLGVRDRLRACFRLELPADNDSPFVLRFLLQSPDDPSLLVDAAKVWRAKGRSLAKLGRAFRDPQESLLEALGRAARLFPPLRESLGEARPERLELAPAVAWTFLSEGAPALGEAGFGVIVPAELTAAGQRRLRLRMKVGATTKTAGAVSGAAGFGFEEMLSFDWEAALGEHALSKRELEALARHKSSLVRHRGQWVVVDPRELAGIRKRLAGGEGRMRAADALIAALSGETIADGVHVAVSARGSFAAVLERLRDAAHSTPRSPGSLRGELRPYQTRGFAWLSTMAELGLGACLADDMGLGKTIQLLAFLLDRRERAPQDRPALLVAPTSVLGNWEREIGRFAPSLEAVPHYGPERARDARDLPQKCGALVLTSYGLLRRDLDLLSRIEWSTVALDEAQNIKNSASATAKAARALHASHRFALTGTPVENRLAELWSILEFLNPGLLGPLETFRREYAVPIERYGNDLAAARLKRIAGPFLLRRLKSDPAIIDDLPPKNEMNVVCTLTREQVTLYQAVVDEEMRRIESAEGIERRGRVLALLSFLKQVCNHPAQYLGEPGPLARRSGKLERVTEMLEEALAAGDKALVFTQFREMGDRLEEHFEARLGAETLFLHGGTPKRKRDEMVRRFQELPQGPRVFVLSVKAGGTGLNLTAASHVFHFDRWWNPAVEDQATDRAYRIGQRRAVQVHKLICAGTVEEKVDLMLEQKRSLASRIVGAGEQWITELGNGDLRELFSLAGHTAVDDETAEDES
ncbi:MAG: DEAD/DEAH box helicase [Woeseia sp.]